MEMNKIMIILPDTVYIKKMKPYQRISPMHEEYNIYYKNIIRPFNDMWDVVIKCAYGKNLGNCWRLSDFTKEDVDSFDFELAVYNGYGERLAAKKSKIVMVDSVEFPKTDVLFLGDSMTHSNVYVEHIVKNSKGIDTVGTRTFDGHIFIEGRGGWSYDNYFNRWYSEFGWCPFLFPNNVSGKDYYGNMEFVEMVNNPKSDAYLSCGFQFGEIQIGQYYTRDKKLYQKAETGDDLLVSETPEFFFDFSKYLERFQLKKPQIISILMGANDLQVCPYEEANNFIDTYIKDTKTMIKYFHDYDANIKIIINLPIIGAEQYSWGKQLNCEGTEKMYHYSITHASKRLIEEFDNKQSEGIYIAPMLACIDPENGFPYTYEKLNKYTEETAKRQSNWVHPNDAGYKQMGDALAAVIEYIRKQP